MVKILLPYIERHYQFEKALWSLKKYTPKEVEIILIDDKERKGMSVVFNKYFTGEDDLILWHADMYATEGWYEKLMKYKDTFDIIGMKLVYPNNVIQHYGGGIKENGVCFHPHQHCLDYGLDKPQECVFVTWGGVLVKKEVIQKVGKIDEQFFQTYYGDVDYCLKARELGFKVGVVPVKLIHEESLDTRQNPKIKEIMENNWNIFQAKWMNLLAGAL